MKDSGDGKVDHPGQGLDGRAGQSAAERERIAKSQVAEDRLADLRARLSRAIAERREVRLVYGSVLTLRLVLPHAVGIGTAGNPLLLAWQVEGGSQTDATGWKHFALDRIRGLDVSDVTFRGHAPGYEPTNSSLAEVWQAL